MAYGGNGNGRSGVDRVSEWKLKEHYHPESVIGYLFELLRSPKYRGRL